MTAPETFVTDDMRATQGVWGEETPSFPVDASDIRRWAIAVYWPKVPPRLFWDEAYARATRWGGIIAPEDFNPFTWPIEDKTGRESQGVRPGVASVPGDRKMNGGTTSWYLAKIRPGDVITERSRLSHWEEVPTRLGPTIFEYRETEWRNQHGEVVRRMMRTGIRY